MSENNIEEKEYIAIGCTGITLPFIKIPTSHLCKISEYNPDLETEKQVLVNWMTLAKAIENFGGKIYLAGSTDICPLCLDLEKNSKDIISGKTSIEEILDKYIDMVEKVDISRYITSN